jgi:hypothetical protein
LTEAGDERVAVRIDRNSRGPGEGFRGVNTSGAIRVHDGVGRRFFMAASRQGQLRIEDVEFGGENPASQNEQKESGDKNA